MNIVIGLFGFVVVLMLLGGIFEIVSAQRDRQRYKIPRGKLIDVGGHKLHLYAQGERKAGQPVVVLEAGVASNSLDWQKVQPLVAEFAQVITYDRAGYGWSEKGNDPRSPQQIVTELHTLLHNADVAPPYILVGHSFGGIYVRLFAETFPDEVVGMILVESSVPSMIKTINTEPELNRLKRVARMKRIGLVRLMLARILSHVSYLEGLAKQQYLAFNMLDSDNVIREARPMYNDGVQLADSVDVPLTVISRQEFDELQSERLWQEYQQELVALSSGSRHIIANTGSHYPALSEPELVTKAIQEMVAKVNNLKKDNS